MRLAFFLLVLANLVFFTWAQGYWGGRDEGREPQRLADQLHPDKIQVAIPAPPPPQGCRLVKGMPAKEAEELQAKATAAGLKAAVQQPADEAATFWVNIPGLPNQAAADKKGAELRALGITDFHIMKGEGGSLAISLGVFRNEGNAGEFLAGLNKKGVKTARVDTRKMSTTADVELRGAADILTQQLPEWLPPNGSATAVDCP